jgi:hypothetical protein
MFKIDPFLITILINQNQVLGEKIKNIYRLPEINKGESAKSPPYCKKKDTLFLNVLKRNNECPLQDSIACNALKDFLMPIVIEKANLRFIKSQFDIMENYKPFITK